MGIPYFKNHLMEYIIILIHFKNVFTCFKSEMGEGEEKEHIFQFPECLQQLGLG